MMKKNLISINIFLLLFSAALIICQLFFYQAKGIPPIMFTPVTGILGIIMALFLPTNNHLRKIFLIVNSSITLIVFIYFLAVTINPDFFV